MSLQRVPVNNFRGGLNTRDGPFDLQPNESPDLLNVTISSLVGQLESRKGKTRLDTAGMPALSAEFMKQVVLSNGIRFLMLSINGGVWACKPNGELIKLFAGTAGTIWDFEQFADIAFKDWVYMGNGVDAPQKWDGIAGATVVWPVAKGALPNGGVLCVWENRMFISYVTANVQRIYFSEFGDPEATIEEYGFLDVRGPEDDLDAVQDLAVLGSRLFVMKRRSVFMITSAVTMQNRRVGGPGAWSRFQTVEMEDKLYFFNPQGLWSTGGVQISMESGSINNYFPKNLNVAEAHKARLVATKDTYPRILLVLPTGESTTNDKLIELIPHINFRRIGGRRYLLLPAFMLHTIPATSLATWNPTAAAELIVGSALVEGAVPQFPSPIAVSDTLQRAEEKPLSNAGKWVKWAWTNTAGMIGKLKAAVEALVAQEVEKSEGARWTVGEFTRAQAEIEILKALHPEATPGAPKLASVTVNANFAAAARSGYSATLLFQGARISPHISASSSLTLYRWDAGVATELGKLVRNEINFSLPELFENYRLGITVNGGKVAVWVNTGAGWVNLIEVADATYIKGYAGFEINTQTAQDVDGKGTFHNFRVAELPATVGRLYKLFNGTTDDGALIEAKYQTSWMSVQGEEPKERLRRLNTELAGDAVVDVFVDFEEAPRFSQGIPLAVGGEGTQYRFSRLRPETHGRFHSVRFRTNTGGKPFLINAAELVLRGGKEH